jgi:hypothetical protein
MNKKLLILAAVFIGICTDAPKALCDCTFVSPYQDRNGWANWCVCMGGHIDNTGGNPVCAGVSGSGGGSNSGSGAASGLAQPFYNAGYGIGQAIGKVLFDDSAEKARERAEGEQMVADHARADELARQEEARKTQEAHDRLSSQLQLSGGGDGNGSSQGSAAESPAQVNPDANLPLIMGDPDTAKGGARSAKAPAPSRPPKVESRGDHAYPADCGPTEPNRTAPITTDLCPGNLVAMTYFCGGDTGCPYVCCPKGLPYLNHCDCKCYAAENFECPTLSKCEVQKRQ